MNLNIKKCLKLLVISIILMLIGVFVAIVNGIIVGLNKGNPSLSELFVFITGLLGIAAAVINIIAYYFGKKGGVKKFNIAFILAIINVCFVILTLILAFVPLPSDQQTVNTFTTVLNIISIASSVINAAELVMACLALGDVVPDHKGLAYTTLLFLAVGVILTSIPVQTVTVVGGLVDLIGIILYITLIFKTQRSYN